MLNIQHTTSAQNLDTQLQGCLVQENEEERDKAGNEEDQYQAEHARWLQWADDTFRFYQAVVAAAEELTHRNKALVDSSKASMIADGVPEELVNSMPGAFVPIEEGLQAHEDSLRIMESFRDVSLLLDSCAGAPLCMLAVVGRLVQLTDNSCLALS